LNGVAAHETVAVVVFTSPLNVSELAGVLKYPTAIGGDWLPVG
jgi:hypothetical protein